MRLITAIVFCCLVCNASAQQAQIKMPLDVLEDKIKGGWAGQTIGVSLGAPYEFRYNGSFIQDYVPLTWRRAYVKEIMTNEPGIYDDLYMDLTFVDVFEKYGLDAPVDSFANAFARAEYMLWHANQAARYNIQHGIKAPASGFWKNNPHADDIDFQIESDFSGLMSPAMPRTTAAIGDRIGHIMNYGDGWYGGIYVGTMYSLAFISNDVKYIVKEGLKSIPEKTRFRQMISDVINWHERFPDDWHYNWLEIQKKWSAEISCPDGIHNAFNIDAPLNAAYVVLGLLYGNGDIGRSMEITTRAGQDADCNPSTVGGILGTMIGYKNIPPYWMQGLEGAEDIDFKYTSMSLNKVYQVGLKHALQNILKNGGKQIGNDVIINSEQVSQVRFEQGFSGLGKVKELKSGSWDKNEISFSFEGNAFVIKGGVGKKKPELPEKDIRIRLIVDGKTETLTLPTNFQSRKHDIYWNYDLPHGKHDVKLEVIEPNADYRLDISTIFYYQ
ncbi:MAG TPA: ADP-ribosylglycohydrolase family protein [Chitinophagaceae bacterium]|nr:ADP-ribosylglycohydrolase family protein [Chitinophagaceae bacterium]